MAKYGRTKKCNQCGKTKLIRDFTLSSKTKNVRRGQCKKCFAANHKEKYHGDDSFLLKNMLKGHEYYKENKMACLIYDQLNRLCRGKEWAAKRQRDWYNKKAKTGNNI